MTQGPLWARIAQTLRAEIAGGARPQGARLPTEAALAARFGVARHTVRHALAAMEAEGLVVARRGAGRRVAARSTDYSLSPRVRFHENLAAQGRRGDRRLLSLETRPAGAREAERLSLEPGAAVVVLEGVSLSDGRPVAVSLSVFPALPGLEGALRGTPSVVAALKACGVADHVQRESRIGARAADAVQAAHLELRAGAPLTRVESLNEDGAGRRVEWGRTWFAGERVTLVVDHP